MRKKIYVIVTLLCFILVAGVASDYSPMNKVYAATKISKKNKKAIRAFNKYLSKNRIAWPVGGRIYSKNDYSFQYMELGKTKVPILIISCSKTCHAEQYVAVLQYIDGKVKFAFAEDWIEIIYQKSGIIAACHSGGGCGEIHTWYYKLNSKGKFRKSVAHTAILPYPEGYMRDIFGEDKYEIGSKKVSKAEFPKWLKKNTGGEKGKPLGKWRKNTAKNRKKYL